MTSLLRTYLRPYRGQITVVLGLLLIGAIGQLHLPTLNGDIINNGVAKGDTDYIIRIGGWMLAASFPLAVAAVAAPYLGARISLGFGRDVRRAVFLKVETF